MRAMTRLSRAAALALAIAGGLWAGHALTSTSAAPETTWCAPARRRSRCRMGGAMSPSRSARPPIARSCRRRCARWPEKVRARRPSPVTRPGGMTPLVDERSRCSRPATACSRSLAAGNVRSRSRRYRCPAAEILVPSEDLAFQLKLPETLQTLDRARVDGRTALARPARIAGRRGRRAGWHASIVPRRTRCVRWQNLPRCRTRSRR